MKRIALTIALLCISMMVYTQTPLSGPPPINTFDSMENIIKGRYLQHFMKEGGDSARALKLYGRHKNFWDIRHNAGGGRILVRYMAH